MITLFEKFKEDKESPFLYKEYIIFHYGDKIRFEVENILVYVEDEPYYNGEMYTAIVRRIIKNSKSNILLTLKYNEDNNNIYTDVLNYELNLLWRGFDEKEAINMINMLNNTEKYNV